MARRSLVRRLALPVALVALAAAFFAFDLGRFLSLDFLKARQASLDALYAARPLTVLASFFAIYVAVAALSLPGAAVLTLAAGALFGLPVGLLVASFASSIGATLAFLVARHLLRDAVQARFGDRLEGFQRNIERDGAFYLFTLRLVPAFPFFLVNLVMGLTRLRTGTFYLVSQLGMLAGTAVFVNAGTQLARIDSLSGILSPALIASFALLGVFPARGAQGPRAAAPGPHAGSLKSPFPLPPFTPTRSGAPPTCSAPTRPTTAGNDPGPSTATWSSSARAPAGWYRPTSARPSRRRSR